MSTTLYYFTGTGNSLHAAKEIAKGLEDAKVLSIAQMIKEKKYTCKSDKIGIVFPVIAWGAPLIVSEFLKAFNFSKDQYIFSVATCGHVPAGSHQLIEKIIKKRGGRLSAGYAIKSGVYKTSDQEDIVPIKMAKILSCKSKARLRILDKKVDEIVKNTKNRKTIKLEGSNLITNIYGNLLHDQIIKVFKTESKNFWTDDKCKQCGVCEKICPVDNIKINKKGIHTWSDNCQGCYACLQWCPQSAIQFKEESKGIKRMQNPKVAVEDML